MYLRGIVVLTLVLGAAMPAAARTIVIGHSDADHFGGQIGPFQDRYDRIRASGAKVEIDGPCASACTIVASLPRSQVCVTPRAVLGVHLASTPNGHPSKKGTARLVEEFYPPALQQWIKRHGGLTDDIKVIRYHDLLTIFPACAGRH